MTKKIRSGEKFGSPIEKLLGQWMVALCEGNGYRVSSLPMETDFGHVHILMQAELGPFIVDFLIQFGKIQIVVECDGKDFHDRYVKQLTRDRKRDRKLLAMGYPTCRFTGSEIYNETEKCAREALSLAGIDPKGLKPVQSRCRPKFEQPNPPNALKNRQKWPSC